MRDNRLFLMTDNEKPYGFCVMLNQRIVFEEIAEGHKCDRPSLLIGVWIFFCVHSAIIFVSIYTSWQCYALTSIFV